MSVIVTAATGNLGSLVVEALLARGTAPADIVATARDTAKLSSFADRGVTTATLDYADPSTVASFVEPGDVLVLISGTEFGKRVEQHSAVITAAKEAGAARVVYTSAPKATTTDLILAPEHKGTEEFLTASGVPFTILRNGWYTENYVGAIEQGRTTGELVESVGDGRVASASRSDYAEAAAIAALDDSLAGQTLELSGDYAWNFDELAAAVSTIVDRPVTYHRVSTDEHVEILKNNGVDDFSIGLITGIDKNIADGLLAETSGDLSRLIGHPTVPLAEGLAAAAV